MVKHIILWQLKDGLSDEEKVNAKNEIKKGLEALKGVVPGLKEIKNGLENLLGKVPGLKEIKVNINPLNTSNADIMLDSLMESFDALKGYAVHPEHVAVADGKVKPNVKLRVCMDYEI